MLLKKEKLDLDSHWLINELSFRIEKIFAKGVDGVGIISVDENVAQDQFITLLIEAYSKRNKKINALFNPSECHSEEYCQNALKDSEDLSKILKVVGKVGNNLCLEMNYSYCDNLENSEEYKSLSQEMLKIADNYIVSLPAIEIIQDKFEVYSTILDQITHVFVFIPEKGVSAECLEHIKTIMSNFDVKIEGMILEKGS